MELWNVLSCAIIAYYQSLSNNTKTRFAVSVLEMLYENSPLIEMLSSHKAAKEYITCMFIAFTGSTSRAGICVACLKLITLGRRIVNRLYRLNLEPMKKCVSSVVSTRDQS